MPQRRSLGMSIGPLPARRAGGTFGGNALGCAVASAVIDTIQEEGLLENATARGSQLAQALTSHPAHALDVSPSPLLDENKSCNHDCRLRRANSCNDG